MNLDEIRSRSARRLQFIVLVAIGFVVLQTCAYFAAWAWAGGDPSHEWSGFISAGAVLLLFGAHAALRKAKLVVGVMALSACFIAVAVAGAAFSPRFWVSDLLLPPASLALAVAYVDSRVSRRLAFVAWLAALAILVFGHRSEMGLGRLTPIPLDEFASAAGSLALVFVLIHHFGQRLKDELEASESHRQAVLAANARISEFDRMKTLFINNVAHELRTPLTPLKTNTFVLMQKSSDADVSSQRALRLIDRNIDRLTGLVDNILDMTRLQDAAVEFSLVPIELGPLVGEVGEGAVESAAAKHIHVDVRYEPGLVVLGDRKRLLQLLATLVGNAIKFTPDGGDVRIEAAREHGELVVRVVDSGIGIAPEEIPRLFAPFVQLGDSMQMTRAGLGLGLYTARMIAIRHGGRLWCESEGAGRGATFTLALPAAPADAPKPPLSSESASALSRPVSPPT